MLPHQGYAQIKILGSSFFFRDNHLLQLLQDCKGGNLESKRLVARESLKSLKKIKLKLSLGSTKDDLLVFGHIRDHTTIGYKGSYSAFWESRESL